MVRVNDKIGIGISAAVARLHIDTTGNAIQITNTTTGPTSGDGMQIALSGSDAFIIQKETAKLFIRTSNINALTIDSVQNVGIGTISPTEKLDVVGSILADTVSVDGALKLNSGDLTSFGNNYSQIKLGFNGTEDFSQWITTTHNSTSDLNRINFYTNDGTQTGVFPVNAVHGMTIMDGKTGIGTVNPTRKLEVIGDATTVAAFIKNDEFGVNTNYADLGRFQSSGAGSNYFYRNLTSADTTSSVVRVHQNNVGDDQSALHITNNGLGKGLLIANNSDGISLEITSASTVTAPLRITNLALDPTGAHIIGDIAVVSGLLKICTVAGTPGTWTVVGTQV